MLNGPSWTSEEVAAARGVPVKASAVVPEAEPVIKPSTPKKPERVAFVPEAFVKFSVGNVP